MTTIKSSTKSEMILSCTTQGPTITWDYDTKILTLDCSDATMMDFLTDPAELLDGGTVGESNRRWVHARADEFLDEVFK